MVWQEFWEILSSSRTFLVGLETHLETLPFSVSLDPVLTATGFPYFRVN